MYYTDKTCNTKRALPLNNETNFVYMKKSSQNGVISILVNFRYLRFKLLKYKENNKKICDTFGHNSRYVPLLL